MVAMPRKLYQAEMRLGIAIITSFLLFYLAVANGEGNDVTPYNARTEDIVVRFVDETFHANMENSESDEFKELAHKVEQQMKLAFANSVKFLDIAVKEMSPGSVYVTMTVTFVQATGLEIPALQVAINELHTLYNMPVGASTMYSSTMVPPPLQVTTVGQSRTTIKVEWQNVPTNTPAGDVLGYTIFFKKYMAPPAAADIWTIAAVPYGQNSFTAEYLEQFTTYTFRVAAYTNDSIGFTSDYSDGRTHEGVPSDFVEDVTCNPDSSTSVKIQWSQISVWNGFNMGYRVHYKIYQSQNPYQNITFGPTDVTGILAGLAGSAFYEMEIAAFTNAGEGPRTWVVCTTEEGVPNAAIGNVSLTQHYSPLRIKVDWAPIDPAAVNGDLIGYAVESALIVDTYGQLIQFPTISRKLVSPYSTTTILQWFEPNSKVQVQVTAVTASGDGPMGALKIGEMCRCPKHIYVKWTRRVGYIVNNGTGAEGPFVTYINNMLYTICGRCIEYETLLATTGIKYPQVYYDRTRDGSFPTEPDLKSLAESVSDNSHIFTPIYAVAAVHVYQADYRFVQIVKSEGAAFIVRSQISEVNSDTVINSIVGVWPMFVIIFLCTYLAGIVMCVTDRDINPEFSQGNFMIGSLQGFWCAFITMTTLGYGDKVPMGVLSRIITVMWSFIGLVLTSILIGAICTSLTVIDTAPYPSLYGTNVAVLNNSVEYSLAIRRNAVVNSTGVLYTTPLELFDALESKKVDGVLLDSLVADSMKATLNKKKLKVHQVIFKPAGYGIVLASELLALEKDIRDYVAQKPLELKTEQEIPSGPQEEGESAIDITMTVMKLGVEYMAIALAIVFVLGLLWYMVKLIRQRQKVEPAGYSSATMTLSEVAKEFNQEMSERIEKLEKKHTSEIIELLKQKNFSFGFKGFATYSSFDEQKLKNKMLFSEIVSKDLN